MCVYDVTLQCGSCTKNNNTLGSLFQDTMYCVCHFLTIFNDKKNPKKRTFQLSTIEVNKRERNRDIFIDIYDIFLPQETQKERKRISYKATPIKFRACRTISIRFLFWDVY